MIPSLQHHQVVGAAAPSLFSHRLSAMITPSAQLDPSPQRVDGFFFFLPFCKAEKVKGCTATAVAARNPSASI
jgi:hypothetical protein